jgi:hypothetical protein
VEGIVEDKALDRRIQFLINEAKSDPPVRDQTGTFALRVITNCFSVGKDVSAREHKKRAPFRSGGALRLASGEDEKPNAEWFNQVTNEHQYTLKRAWEWMLREANTLTVSRVREHLAAMACSCRYEGRMQAASRSSGGHTGRKIQASGN